MRQETTSVPMRTLRPTSDRPRPDCRSARGRELIKQVSEGEVASLPTPDPVTATERVVEGPPHVIEMDGQSLGRGEVHGVKREGSKRQR
jgi:hypothetical protein